MQEVLAVEQRPVAQMAQLYFLSFPASFYVRCPRSKGCPRFCPSQAFLAHWVMLLTRERWIMSLLTG